MQPAARIARRAVEQADRYCARLDRPPEKQSVDCLLVTRENVGDFGIFELLRAE